MNAQTPIRMQRRGRHSVPGLRNRRASGFTMLELSFILSALAGLVMMLAYLTTDLFAKRQGMDGDRLLMLADAQIKEFAARKGRLPCPDTSNTGVENCNAAAGTKGLLPYRTLGLSTQTYVVGETPLRYGVFRHSDAKGALDADLAARKLRFSPRNSDDKEYPETDPLQANTADFCLALSNADAKGFLADRAHVSYPDGSRQNIAYALAFPGSDNRDGVDGRYDLLNAGDGPGFQARNTLPASNYDDKTLHRSFKELYVGMNCEVVLRSLDFVADAVAFEEEVFALADSNQNAAFVGTILAGVGTGVAAWGLAQSIAEVAGASEVLGVSTGLLSAASATCPIPPWVTCALIPVYATAVASASTGIALTAVGAAFNGAAVGLQLVATLKYADIKTRTGLDRPSTLPPASADQMAALTSQFDSKNAELLAAEGVLLNLVAEETALRNAATGKRTELEGIIEQFSTADSPYKAMFTLYSEQMFGKETGAKETITVTYVDQNGTEKTETVEKSVVEPGAYQAVLGLRDAKQALARAQANEASATEIAAAQAKVDAARLSFEQERDAVPATIEKFDAYDGARAAQAAAKTDMDQKKASYDALAASCTSSPATCDAAALTAAQTAWNSATTTYNTRTTERATRYSALGFAGPDTGTGGLCGGSACNVISGSAAYLGAEERLDAQASRTDSAGEIVFEAVTSDRLAQEKVVSALRGERNALEVQIGTNTCMMDNKDYDPVAKACTAGTPGSAAAAATQSAVCDSTQSTYDKPSCDALTAAAGTPPQKLEPVQGAENILKSLKREGAVR